MVSDDKKGGGGVYKKSSGSIQGLKIRRNQGEKMRKILAAFIAAAAMFLSTTSFATVNDNQVTSQKIREADGTTGQDTNTGSGVKTGHIQDEAVTTGKIANGAVTDDKISGTISASKIQDGVFQKKVAGVIVVAKSGGDFATIQSAVNSISPTADNPYVIKVMPGTYIENIVMKSYTSLLGAGQETTLIQSNINDSAILLSNISNAVISGFAIKGSNQGCGVNINNASNVVVKDNSITSHDYGVQLVNSPNVTITGNTITMNTYRGIVLMGGYSSNDLIEGNTVSDNQVGIELASTPSATVRGNTAQRNSQSGIFGAWCSPLIVNNVVTGNNTGQMPWAGDITLGENFTPRVSFNVFDTIGNNGGGTTFAGQYNVKSDGTPAP
jgi:parallel beta-helix repeat protein